MTSKVNRAYVNQVLAGVLPLPIAIPEILSESMLPSIHRVPGDTGMRPIN